MAIKIIDNIKSFLGNIPRQNFLYYNKREAINVISSCYEQIKETTKVCNKLIDLVNSGYFNGKDGKPGEPGPPGKDAEIEYATDKDIDNIFE